MEKNYFENEVEFTATLKNNEGEEKEMTVCVGYNEEEKDLTIEMHLASPHASTAFWLPLFENIPLKNFDSRLQDRIIKAIAEKAGDEFLQVALDGNYSVYSKEWGDEMHDQVDEMINYDENDI